MPTPSTTPRRTAIAAALVALSVLGAGCGEGEETIAIRLTDFELEPRRPEIGGPAEVRFRIRNEGSVAHALTVVGPKEEVEIEPLAPGGKTSFTLDLDEPGRYKMFCPVGDHAGRGMRGSITVD